MSTQKPTFIMITTFFYFLMYWTLKNGFFLVWHKISEQNNSDLCIYTRSGTFSYPGCCILVFNYRPSHWNKFLYRLLNYKGRRSIFILTLAGTIYTEICSKANLVSSCQIGIKYCESFSNLECYWTFLGDTYSFSGCKIYECYSSLCQSCWHGIIA